jgi:hypothetical protein
VNTTYHYYEMIVELKEETMNSRRNSKWSRVLVITGGIITLGFGVWHSAVPWLYNWFDYMTAVPDELTNAVLATNLFLAISLIFLGILATLVGVFQWYNHQSGKLVLWLMSLLWIARVAYQAVKPQGTMIPHLPVVLMTVFVITALCFVIPIVVLKKIKINKSTTA